MEGGLIEVLKLILHQQLFMEIRDRYRDYLPVYTDCSRDGNAVAVLQFFHQTP